MSAGALPLGGEGGFCGCPSHNSEGLQNHHQFAHPGRTLRKRMKDRTDGKA